MQIVCTAFLNVSAHGSKSVLLEACESEPTMKRNGWAPAASVVKLPTALQLSPAPLPTRYLYAVPGTSPAAVALWL